MGLQKSVNYVQKMVKAQSPTKRDKVMQKFRQYQLVKHKKTNQ